MRIPSGTLDQFIYFVAVDSTDLKTRETGLSSFTVYRSRDGAAAVAYTTPTVNETDTTNMPGVYELLLDEDMTIAAGNDSEEVCLHITQASMAPVTRVFELYRSKITLGETITAANGAADADIERLQGSLIATPTVAGVLEADVTHWLGTAAATPTIAGVPEVDVTHFNGTAGTFAAGRPEVNTSHAAGTAWNSGAIAAGTFAADAITAAKVAADVSAEIADAVWDEDATAHQNAGTFGQAIGDPGADANTIFKAVVTDATGATVGVDVVAVKAQTAAIEVDTTEIGAAGAGLTAINLPNQTMDIVGNITGNLSGSVGSVTVVSDKTGYALGVGGIASTAFAASAVDAAALAADAVNEIRDSVFARAFSAAYGSHTFDELVKMMSAVLYVVASGMATTTGTFRNLANTADVIVATVDADGNRTAVTRTP